MTNIYNCNLGGDHRFVSPRRTLKCFSSINKDIVIIPNSNNRNLFYLRGMVLCDLAGVFYMQTK